MIVVISRPSVLCWIVCAERYDFDFGFSTLATETELD